MKIVKYPHPALRYKSPPLPFIDKEVRLNAGRMLELMYANRGLGLAANQVAWPVQLLVMNASGDAEHKESEAVLINPVILERKGTMEGDEGCLSFPDLYQKVRRAKTVKVQAYNLDSQAVEIVCSDLPSRILQHEIDHLHGILYIDNFGPIGKMASRSWLRGFEREYRRAQEKGEIPTDIEIGKQLDAQVAEMKRKANGEPPPVM